MVPKIQRQKLRVCAVMITVDRSPKKNYLSESLASLERSGWFSYADCNLVVINASPDSDTHLSNVVSRLAVSSANNFTVIATPERLGCTKATQFALQHAAWHECDWVLFMEDDIEVCRDFPERVMDFLQDHGGDQLLCDFVTCYDDVLDRYLKGELFWDMPAVLYYGNQCFALKRHVVKSYADYIDRSDGKRPGFPDVWIADWLMTQYTQTMLRAAVPSLAQHRGDQSTQNNSYFEAQAYIEDLEGDWCPDDYPVVIKQAGLLTSNDNFQIVVGVENPIFIKINRAAARVFELCSDALSVGDVIDTLVSDWPANESEIEVQVPQVLDQLRSLRVIYRQHRSQS
ncbi:MAG: hypothetical protein DHS20C01_15950 [marine bacterium B5-7]|nr:MAG: hypothetical protein DHS20C01_15950 [marine bacterium B5-7]